MDEAMKWNADGQLEALTFNLAGETFAIEAMIVREILDHLPETKVPGADAHVGGLLNFRGRIIPLADLRVSFGLESTEETLDSRIVVIECDYDGAQTLVGIRADKVHEVTYINRSDIEPTPRIGMRWPAEFIRCMARRDGDFIIVPDLERMLMRARPAGRRGLALVEDATAQEAAHE
jgi:purine-binding chemotaxis protein CheW